MLLDPFFLGVPVQFGARSFGGGDGQLNDWFDNVTIHGATVQSTYFLTSGNATTPGGLF